MLAMMNHHRFLLIVSTLFLGLSAHAQDRMMSMYLEPDANGTVYFQESMTNLNRLQPRPLLDGSGAGQGWMFVQYPGTYVAYVQAADLTANNQVRDGSKAYLEPNASSPVMSVIIDGDNATVSRVQNGWATVTYVGKAPAYFRADQSSVTPAQPLEIIADTNAPATPAPRATQPAAAPRPAPRPAQTNPAGGPPVLEEVVMQESAQLPPAQPNLRPPAQSVARYIQGRLEPVSVWDRTFGSKYKYRLINANDDTIAYVVLDDSLIFGPVEDYWGKTVEIQGVMKKITGLVPLEVQAGAVRVIR